MTDINLTLKDGSKRQFKGPLSGLEVAHIISPRLAKEAVAMRVNGVLRDLSTLLSEDTSIDIITRNDPEGLDVLRHGAAHVMAEAVQELFPGTQVTIGPAIENGFYYDFYRTEPFTPEDLVKIEAKMRDIVARNEAVVREEWDRDEAVAFFSEKGETFKAEIIGDLPEGMIISLYRQGAFVDLCRGPHIPSTGHLGAAFKLMSLAGAYWRGDHRNQTLQRIYGTAWATEQQLKDYLFMLEEAEKRDHRRLGPELKLFHLQEEAPGSVFWHAKGWTVYRLLEAFMRRNLEAHGYIEVKTPQLLDSSLWKASGHWDKFGENMFTVKDEDRVLALKPMNCPCHVQIFKQGIKSYRDLPLRMAEFGSCFRNEPSGALHGIMRVRAMTQDDAHIFCTPEQIVDETKAFCDLLKMIYRAFGFEDILVRFSDRPEKRAGTDETWDQAEKALQDAATAAGLSCVLNSGEGAFYGPKLEFVLTDALGRKWQCGTLQVDFVLPERLDSVYIGEDGERHRPVMLHRAILGSFERFMGILIENYSGKFPLWLAPVQVVVATITSDADAYAEEVVIALKAAGLRAEIDVRNEKITYKIREHSLQKIPCVLVVGKREVEQEQVAMRWLGGETQQVLSLREAVEQLKRDAKPPLAG